MEENDSITGLSNLLYKVLPRSDPEDDKKKLAYINDSLFLTERILKGESIEFEYLLDLFIPELLTRFRKGQDYQRYCIRTFMLLEFLRDLGDKEDRTLIEGYDHTMNKSFEQLMEEIETTEDETLKEFFENYGHALGTAEKRAAFLEGVLAQHLMDKQRGVRGDEDSAGDAPFQKKLSNLRLNERKLKDLFPQIREYLGIYNEAGDAELRSGYPDLEATLGHYFLEAEEEGWNLDEKELRYFFMLGLSLNKAFKGDHNNGGE
jgi:CRISPR-associated protein Cas8b/Csh1 subtype I-B